MSGSEHRRPNILSVDVEDWFHVLEVRGDGVPGRADWDRLDHRVEENTEALLEMFEQSGVRGTFFIVGWVAWRHPDLVRRIAKAGHEIASHSFWHEVMRGHDRHSLAADLEASRKLLQDLSGQAVRGFRAPGGSITPHTAWALDVIAEQGFTYDSSLCPGASSHGGFPSPWLGPHWLRCQSGWLLEIPSSTWGIGRRRIPYGGGGYLRLFPVSLTNRLIAQDNGRGRPANLYVHPREIDPEQPRMPLPWKRRFKYYVGLRSTRRKLEALLRDHRFLPAWEWLEANEDVLHGRTLDVRSETTAHPPPAQGHDAPPAPPFTRGQPIAPT